MSEPVAPVLKRLVGTPPETIVELKDDVVGTVYRVGVPCGDCVILKRSRTPPEAEADQLAVLDDRTPIPVPGVIAYDDSWLVLEAVDGDHEFSDRAARAAAELTVALHDVAGDAFGFPVTTYRGPFAQPNERVDDWVEFYARHRLRWAIDLAVDRGVIDAGLADRLEGVVKACDRLLEPPDTPTLLHGDLWAENVLAVDDRITGVLDPALWYGHREVELAYVDWTDSFGDPFFDRYERLRGIDEGFWETRRYVYRLVPLLIHAVLFETEPYTAELDRTLDELGIR